MKKAFQNGGKFVDSQFLLGILWSQGASEMAENYLWIIGRGQRTENVCAGLIRKRVLTGFRSAYGAGRTAGHIRDSVRELSSSFYSSLDSVSLLVLPSHLFLLLLSLVEIRSHFEAILITFCGWDNPDQYKTYEQNQLTEEIIYLSSSLQGNP